MVGAQALCEGAEDVAFARAELFPDFAAARVFDNGELVQIGGQAGRCELGERAQAGEVGAPRVERDGNQSHAVFRVDVHLRAVFDPRERRFGGVHVPQAVAEVAEDGNDRGGQQGEHAPPAADAEVQPAAFGFEIDDEVADGSKGCLGVTFAADVFKFAAVTGDRDMTQPAAPSGIVVVNEFGLQPLPRLPGARVGKREVQNVDFADGFPLCEQGIEGEGDDLGLAAEGGDQRSRLRRCRLV